MRILISNDDGIAAKGLSALGQRLAADHQVITIAPDRERSSCGHGITLGEPVRLYAMGENRYSCTGFPADCVLVGLGHVLKNTPPDVVISGINHGANLGQDRYYSGTIAAAREAAFRNIPSIAVSLVTTIGDEKEHFETAARVVQLLLQYQIHELINPYSLININIPNRPWEEIKGLQLAELGLQKYTYDVVAREDTRGRHYFWLGGSYEGSENIPGSDGNAVAEGWAALTIQTFEVWNFISPEQKALAKEKFAEKLKQINDENF